MIQILYTKYNIIQHEIKLKINYREMFNSKYVYQNPFKYLI